MADWRCKEIYKKVIVVRSSAFLVENLMFTGQKVYAFFFLLIDKYTQLIIQWNGGDSEITLNAL